MTAAKHQSQGKMNQKITQNEKMITRQTFYITILIAITLGFLLGCAYTSFKLAGAGPAEKGHKGMRPMKDAGADMPKEMPVPQEGPGENASVPFDAMADAHIKEIQDFLEENPDNAEAWTRLGNAYFDISRFDQAIHAYEKSLAIEPDNPHVLTDLGVMLRRNNEPQKALEAFDKAVAIKPDFETAWFNKGIVLMHDLNNVPEAIEAWQQLVKVNPMARTSSGKLISELIDTMHKTAE